VSQISHLLLDPTNERVSAQRAPAERPRRLDGVTVGLLDISKPRGDVFLDHLEALLRDRGFNIERFRKPTFAKPAPLDLRREIAQRCQVVIEALAD
jgi:hypothetical protein